MSPDSMISEQYPGHRFLVIETLLGQDEVISTLSKKDRKDLLKESYMKYTRKAMYPGKFAYFGIVNNLALMGKILIAEEFAPFIQSFSDHKAIRDKIKWGVPGTKEEGEELMKHVEQFLNLTNRD